MFAVILADYCKQNEYSALSVTEAVCAAI